MLGEGVRAARLSGLIGIPIALSLNDTRECDWYGGKGTRAFSFISQRAGGRAGAIRFRTNGHACPVEVWKAPRN
jgi:hypothetical protein